MPTGIALPVRVQLRSDTGDAKILSEVPVEKVSPRGNEEGEHFEPARKVDEEAKD